MRFIGIRPCSLPPYIIIPLVYVLVCRKISHVQNKLQCYTEISSVLGKVSCAWKSWHVCAKYFWLHQNFYYMHGNLLTDVCGSQKYYQVLQNACYIVVGFILWAWKALLWVSLHLFIYCQHDSIWRSSFPFLPFLLSVHHVVFLQTQWLSVSSEVSFSSLSWVSFSCVGHLGSSLSEGSVNVIWILEIYMECTKTHGSWPPCWYKLSLNYLNSIRMSIFCEVEGNKKCISGR